MTRYICDSDYGKNQTRLPIEFEPSAHDTPEAAAKAFYEAMKPVVRAYGQDPDSELYLNPPNDERKVWQVVWEAGPYEWAIVASLTFMMGKRWFTEPYYSFDLCFEEA